jgi:hypothetical protein
MERSRIGNGLDLIGGVKVLVLHRDGRRDQQCYTTCPKVSPKSGFPVLR